ncbi:BsuPI-related putative proteinase inhibitor [Virgibacillus sp. SK37]|uniref:BsuPI-related putative proteinase inhibitor n=1 Tax=Virgibacillus sp. SK37 TaxID=403957 RepID=UPI0004D10CE3|nr:BsuPI-related putative proteinase inhibitor [Virgibacillus sp. SK37]AIF45322.1 hypothetical protein X953_07050 [Virgibacillus sp. SK37]
MILLRLSLFLILLLVFAGCGQQADENERNDDKDHQHADEAIRSGGIVAGELETTLEVKESQAILKIKNQTEQVKELIFSEETAYEYFILDEKGKTVFQKSEKDIPYDQEHPLILKQAEEADFKLAIPNDLEQGTHTITTVLHTDPVIETQTTFTVEKK